jgi:CRP/FNR family transcriptional regulator, cyclic AMP receptor protein
MISPELLRRYPFFSGLSETELHAIAMLAQEKEFAAGSIVSQEGRPVDYFGLLLEGELDVQMAMDGLGANNETMSTLSSGQAFNWEAIVDPHTLNATIFCPEKARVLLIEAQGLMALLGADNHLACLMLRKTVDVLAEALRNARIQMLSMVSSRR